MDTFNNLMGVITIKKLKAFFSNQYFWIYLSFLILSIIFTIPIIHNFYIIISGDDYSFHLPRVYSLYTSLKQHVLLPTLDFHAFNGRATAYNIFYPYIMTSLPIVIFKFLFNNWLVSFQLFFVVTTFLTLLLAFVPTKKLTNNTWTSYVFALLYSFTQYRIVNAYVRFDLGEYMAMTFVPLVLLSLELLIQKRNYRTWYLIGLGMTGLIYSHLLTALMVAAIIFIRLIVSYYEIKKETIICLLKSIGLALVLSLYQITILAEQFLHIKLVSVAKVDLTFRTPSISNLLQQSLDDPLSFSVGLIVLIAGLFAIGNINKLASNNLNGNVFLLLGTFLLLTTTSFFPWALLNKTPMNIIQYPFRLTLFASFYLLLAGTLSVTNSLQFKFIKKSSFVCLLFILFTVLGQFVTTTQKLSANANQSVIRRNLQIDHFDVANYVNTSLVSDYRPVNSPAIKTTIEEKKFSVNHSKYNDTIKLHVGVNSYFFNYQPKSNVTIDTPIVDYKGIVITDNNRVIHTNRSKRGTLEISLTGKISHHVVVRYQNTMLQKTSAIMSILGLLATICFPFYQHKYDDKKELNS